jgi:hypothetical protein
MPSIGLQVKLFLLKSNFNAMHMQVLKLKNCYGEYVQGMIFGHEVGANEGVKK